MKSRHYRANDSEQFLQQKLDRLKKEDALLQPSSALRNRLLEALAAREPSTAPQTGFWMKAAAVFVISLFCGSIWILKPELRKNVRPQLNNTQEMNGYLPITYGLTPEESLQRVRVKLPRSALNDFGIQVHTIRSEEVTADVLVGESGLPYAIRVVQKN